MNSQSPLQSLKEPLLKIVGPQGLLDATEVAQRSAGMMRDDNLQAGLLVRPQSTEEVVQIMALCHERGQSLVTQSGLTGLVHATDANAGQLILSTERLNRIEVLDPQQRIAVVQSGVVLQQLQEAASAQGLFFPLDLGARGSCTIGGNISTNAGGNRVIRYGMTRPLVLGIEAVLADGTLVSSLNQMLKNNAGYDLKQLFIGTEGTLGVITRAVVRLFEQPRSQNLALVAVDEFSQVVKLLRFVDSALGGALSAFEVMWNDFYETVTRAPAKNQPPLPHGHGWYVLIESQGGHPESDGQRFRDMLGQALEQDLLADAVVANSQREVEAIWAIRDDVTQTNRYGLSFMFDVGLPVSHMDEYVRNARKALHDLWADKVHVWTWGHMGDGNLHFAVRTPPGSDEEHQRVNEILYRPLAALGGSISAEHGIGLEKRDYLDVSRKPEEIALMKLLKRTLDPKDILNPGKVIAIDD